LRTLRTTLAAATLATAGLLAVAAPAANAAPSTGTEGEVLGVVLAQGDAATIVGRYRCFGGTQAHLWASIKQGDDIDGTTQTSSEFADSWYDTNYNFTESNPQGLTVPCDGRFHTQRFVLERVFGTPWGGSFDGTALESGPAWVQFCLVPSEDDESTASSFGEFLDVRAV
jgi:hypothetical protein